MISIKKVITLFFAISICISIVEKKTIFAEAGNSQREIGIPDNEEIEYPDGSPPSKEEISLGKVLFFDKRLSGNQKISCATCHNPNLGFSDGMSFGLGANGKKLKKNSPHLYNLAWNSTFFWDGRADSLEQQALMPIASKDEMNMPLEEMTGRLEKVNYYKKSFKKIYGTSKITKENIARAISSFERTIISKNSPFDKYIKGDKKAMTPEEIRGMILFKGKASCITCHDGRNFTDESFHNIGVSSSDEGRGAIVKDKSLMNAFKTPGLRNVAFTAPYMHDGSIATLEEVILFYNKGGNHSQGRDKLIKPLDLSDQEVFDLVAFMGALSDPVKIDPPQVP